jgi:hypothetical protein
MGCLSLSTEEQIDWRCRRDGLSSVAPFFAQMHASEDSIVSFNGNSPIRSPFDKLRVTYLICLPIG